MNPVGAAPLTGNQAGNPFVARGAVYFQPQAAHNYFLSKVDLAKAAEDFDLFKSYGFNTVALDINWGELVARVDGNLDPTVINGSNVLKLKALAQLAEEKGMFVYVLPLNQIVPVGSMDRRSRALMTRRETISNLSKAFTLRTG